MTRQVRKLEDTRQDEYRIESTVVTGTSDGARRNTREMTTFQYTGSERDVPNDASGPECRIIPAEFAGPECPLCEHVIQEVNEIFQQDDSTCPDPREYGMTHLLEAVHTSLVRRLSKQ